MPKSLPFSFAKKYNVFIEDHQCFYIPPMDITVFSEIQRILGTTDINLIELDTSDFQKKLTLAYELGSNEASQIAADISGDTDLAELLQKAPHTEDLLDQKDDAPIIRLLNAIFTQAIKQQASDIHIEPFEDKLVVRLRVDGVLHTFLEPERVLAPLLASRIKVLAKLDIAEKRLPQDGRIGLKIAGRAVDIRVSTIPSSHGERLVLRILDKDAARLDLTHLGMPDDKLKSLMALISQPHGIILVTGPTGAGKTTTLYAALTQLNDSSRNILTVEDPIEYDLGGIGQTQVNTKVDMTFAKGLRAILRQDPDVVMVGEIRDLETTSVAIQASLTGHLVLSTLHTNTAIGAITRLRDMGVESFLLSSTLIGVVAQRLVRVLCKNCKESYSPDKTEQQQLNCDSNTQIYKPKGCDECNHIGYKGRTGIYEVIKIDEKLKNLIHQNGSEEDMINQARLNSGSIFQDGIDRVLMGQTSLAEVLRVA